MASAKPVVRIVIEAGGGIGSPQSRADAITPVVFATPVGPALATNPPETAF